MGLGGANTLTFYNIFVVPLSAVPKFRNSKTENFLFLFKKIGRAQNQKKCRENFSVLDANFFKVCGRKAERRESKIGIGIFFKKSSNFVQQTQHCAEF